MTNPTIYIDDFARANFPQSYDDWSPIVAAALASFDHSVDGAWNAGGGEIVFGPGPGSDWLTGGNYAFKSPALPGTTQGYGIELNRTVRLRGVSPGAASFYPRSQLHFAPGLGGIRANSAGYPLSATGVVSGLLGASGFELVDLLIQGPGPSAGPASANGVDANCIGRIAGCSIQRFPGNGVYLFGNPGDVPIAGGDGFVLERCDISQHGVNGLFIDGHDMNQVHVIACMMTRNPCGFRDNSLTGAFMAGGLLEGNALDAWSNNQAAATYFSGVYMEAGEKVTLAQSCTVSGGTLASNLLGDRATNTPDAHGWPMVYGGAGQVSWFRSRSPSKTGEVQVGSQTAGSDYFLYLRDFREAVGSWPFALRSYTSGGIGFDWASLGKWFLLLVNSRCLKSNGFPIDAAKIPEFASGGVAVAGLAIGPASAMIFVGSASSAPISTTYPVGSIIHNTSASAAGDPAFWKLVSRAGTLSWVPGGALLA